MHLRSFIPHLQDEGLALFQFLLPAASQILPLASLPLSRRFLYVQCCKSGYQIFVEHALLVQDLKSFEKLDPGREKY